MKPDKPHPLLSPFRWAEEDRPSIFANDQHFRSRHKAGLLDDKEGLGYKQFGTYSKAVVKVPDPHLGDLKHAAIPK